VGNQAETEVVRTFASSSVQAEAAASHEPKAAEPYADPDIDPGEERLEGNGNQAETAIVRTSASDVLVEAGASNDAKAAAPHAYPDIDRGEERSDGAGNWVETAIVRTLASDAPAEAGASREAKAAQPDAGPDLDSGEEPWGGAASLTAALRGAALASEAEKAIADKENLRAAKLYADAADLVPSRSDYRMMSGHCLKDARDFHGAFDAYSAVLTTEPSGDVYVQLGRLLKITGNLNEEEWAYREGDRLGDESAHVELINVSAASAGQLDFFDAAPGPGEATREAFWEVILCRRGETLSHESIRNAGKSLALHKISNAARAFFEIAYLADDAEAFRQEHYALVQRSSLWSATHLSELVKAKVVRTDRRATPARLRLQQLVAQMAPNDGFDPEEPLRSAAVRESGSDWPPVVLSADVAEQLLGRLVGAIDQAYRAFAVETPISGASVIEAVKGLRQAALLSDHVITFPTGATISNLRLVAAGVLNALVRRWLRDRGNRFLGAYVLPEQIAADVSVGGSPLADLTAEMGSAAAVFDEINRQHPDPTAGSSNSALDSFFSRLAATGAPALTTEQFNDFLEEAIKRRLPRSINVLCWSLIAAEAPVGRIIHFAQRLKSAGYLTLAYELMKQRPEERSMPDDYLVEKALLAKINGDFATAARLLEQVAATDLANAFARQELAAVLPEVEPIAGIVDRFQADTLFITAARGRPYYRKALGEEPLNLDEVFFDEGAGVFDIAPEMASEFAPPVNRTLREEIEFLDVGRERRRSAEGELSVLRALDFVRVRAQSATKIVRMRARVDGKTVGVATPALLASSDPIQPIKTMIFNCWLDLSAVGPGAHELQVYLEEGKGGYRSRETPVWVDPSAVTPSPDLSASVFALPPDTEGLTVEERVNRLPTVVLPAERNIFQGEFKNVLVVRADQLGDVALSLSAMFALRDLFPKADLTCLAASSNRDLLVSAGLFSEVHTVELMHDPSVRRRFASLAEQLRLRRVLQAKPFDLAIDLSPGGDSRPLLRLANARYTVGFSPGQFPWLSFGIELETRDIGSGREGSPHATRPMALVAALGGAMRHVPFRLPSPNADPGLLVGLGLDANRAFATLHSGARTASRKWPLANYLALAERLINEHSLQVALILDSARELEGVKAAVLGHPDLHAVAERLSFQQFDALLSCCAVFVGNDTGPKHLASVRGAPVVSIHMGAVNWREWGQEAGFIVTRRTPCYGCGIEAIEECAKGLPCLVNISVDDVYGAVGRALATNVEDKAIIAAQPPVEYKRRPEKPEYAFH
jgi:ADP-heptose:LPS heptosyltransferase